MGETLWTGGFSNDGGGRTRGLSRDRMLDDGFRMMSEKPDMDDSMETIFNSRLNGLAVNPFPLIF